MLFALYSITAIGLIALVHRLVLRLSYASMLFVFLVPLGLTGVALVGNRALGPIDGTYIGVPLSVARQTSGVGVPHNLHTTDIYSQMIPWRHAVRESLANGEWPLWNPYILCGDILAGAAQPAPYSPFTLLALLLPAPVSFTFTAALTLLVAALGAFLFARELGCRESAASIAAVGFAFANAMTAFVLWPLALCWGLFPFVLLGTRRVVASPSFRTGLFLTIVLALLILAGHPESVLHIVALSCFYGLLELVRASARTRTVAVTFVAGAVALLLCAVYLIPILEALPQTAEYSWRQFLRGIEFRDSGKQVLIALSTNAFPFLHLRRWMDVPNAGVRAETAAVGSIVLALAVYALLRARSRYTWFFGATALVCLLAQASWPPLMSLFRRIPLFDLAMNMRLAFAAAFCLALLAALGAEELARRDDRRFALLVFTLVLIALTLGTVLLQRVRLEPELPWGTYRVFAEIAFLSLAALLLAVRTRHVLAALVVLIAIQRILSDGGIHKSFPASAAYPSLPIFEPLRNVREPFRITGLGVAFVPGTSTLYGFEDVRGYEAMTFAPLVKTYPIWCTPNAAFPNLTNDLTRPMLSMMNVRFAFAGTWEGIPPGWREVTRQKWAALLENTNALPRAFIPATVRIGLDDEAALHEMRDWPDFSQRAWITANDAPYERINGPGRITRLTRPAIGAYELEVDMAADGWVIVSDSAWNGWRASINGRRVRTQRANLAFLGVYIPAGKHRVELRYRPQSFVRGRAISLVTLVAIFAALIVMRARSRRIALRFEG